MSTSTSTIRADDVRWSHWSGGGRRSGRTARLPGLETDEFFFYLRNWIAVLADHPGRRNGCAGGCGRENKVKGNNHKLEEHARVRLNESLSCNNMPDHNVRILTSRCEPSAMHRKPEALPLGGVVVASQAVKQNASKAASICPLIYTDVRMLGNLSQECQRVPQFALRVYRHQRLRPALQVTSRSRDRTWSTCLSEDRQSSRTITWKIGAMNRRSCSVCTKGRTEDENQEYEYEYEYE